VKVTYACTCTQMMVTTFAITVMTQMIVLILPTDFTNLIPTSSAQQPVSQRLGNVHSSGTQLALLTKSPLPDAPQPKLAQSKKVFLFAQIKFVPTFGTVEIKPIIVVPPAIAAFAPKTPTVQVGMTAISQMERVASTSTAMLGVIVKVTYVRNWVKTTFANTVKTQVNVMVIILLNNLTPTSSAQQPQPVSQRLGNVHSTGTQPAQQTKTLVALVLMGASSLKEFLHVMISSTQLALMNRPARKDATPLKPALSSKVFLLALTSFALMLLIVKLGKSVMSRQVK